MNITKEPIVKEFMDYHNKTGMMWPEESKQSIPRMKIFLDYEIRSSWWAELIWFTWGQDLAAKYFAWKVQRKYNKYLHSRNMQHKINSNK
jgi:hypothetical protein